ncbi:MAG: hypothetical protein ABIR91_05250 [Candidatus Saccharimonadales bacterium]
MEYLTDLLADVEERIDHIRTIGDINDDLVSIAVNNLYSVKADLVATGRNGQIINKVNRQINMYDKISLIPEVKKKLPIIYEQMIVLMVGALEVYIADIFRGISNKNPEYLVWKIEKEKISFEPILLAEGFTLGDVIIGHLKSQGFSFQDLRSTLSAFEKYFDIRIELDDVVREKLILAAACRNVIVHNRSTIDGGFQKQVRATSFYDDKNYKKGGKLKIDDTYTNQLGETIKEFCRNITVLLMHRNDG